MKSLPFPASVHTVASPWKVWLIVLTVTAATEYAIMLVLPVLLYGRYPRLLESTVDAVTLSAVLSPVLWATVVRPLRMAGQQRARFVAELFDTIEQERRRMAHELHDGVGQSLTLVISGLRSLPEQADPAVVDRRSRYLKDVAEMGLTEVKRLALGLRPSLLDDLGLLPAIERVVADLQSHHALEVTVVHHDFQGTRFSESAETALFRIFQEAMNNIVKHAEATHVEIRLMREPGAVVMEVSDDGRGIAPHLVRTTTETGGHLGVIGMRERAMLLGGELAIESARDKGTRVIARIPVKAAR